MTEREFIINSDSPQSIRSMEEAGYRELVRCKECVHYRYYGLDSYPVSECKIDHEENPDEEWFCADGKREN